MTLGHVKSMWAQTAFEAYWSHSVMSSKPEGIDFKSHMCVSDCEAARVLHCKDRWDSDFEDLKTPDPQKPIRSHQKKGSEKRLFINTQRMKWLSNNIYPETFSPHASPFSSFLLHNPINACCVSKRSTWADVFWLAGRPGTSSFYASKIDGNARGSQSGWHDSRQEVPEDEQLMTGIVSSPVASYSHTMVYWHFYWNLLYCISSCKCYGLECLISLLFNVFQLNLKIHKIYSQKSDINVYSRRFAIKTVLWDDCELSMPAVVVFIDVMLCNRHKQMQRHCFWFCCQKNLIGQDIKYKLP